MMLEKITYHDISTVGNIGDIWVNTLTNTIYKLVSKIKGSDDTTNQEKV